MPDLETLAARARDALELPPHPEGCDRAIERGPERDVDGPLGPLCSIGTCDEPAVRAAVAFWSSSEPPLWDQVCERHRCDACRARALAADVLDLVARVRDLEAPPAHDWTEAEAAALGFARDQRIRGGIIIPDSVIAAEVGKARRAASDRERLGHALARVEALAAMPDAIRGATMERHATTAYLAAQPDDRPAYLAAHDIGRGLHRLRFDPPDPLAEARGTRGVPPFVDDPDA